MGAQTPLHELIGTGPYHRPFNPFLPFFIEKVFAQRCAPVTVDEFLIANKIDPSELIEYKKSLHEYKSKFHSSVDTTEYVDYVPMDNFEVYKVRMKHEMDGKIVSESESYSLRKHTTNIETFEKAEILGMVEDEGGNETEVVVKTFTRVKSSKRPTLTEARKIQVNVFNNKFTRDI